MHSPSSVKMAMQLMLSFQWIPVTERLCVIGGISAQNVQDLLIETTEYRFGSLKTPHTVQWLTDNGKCFTAKATVDSLGFDVRTTAAYSPQSNGVAEAFVKTFKRDYVWFGDLSNAEAVMKIMHPTRASG
ncbi:MAG: hypothetical protein EBR01_14825 [Proteobacteria bacterium]|nr:hypothetical protein [Pseudomonadota bacterium]